MAETAATRDAELAPQLPAAAPSHLQHLLAAYDESVRLDAPGSALRNLREALAYLLGYFTDLTASACVHFGASRELFLRDPASSLSLTEAENRLREGLHFLSSRMESPLAKSLVSIFFDLQTQDRRDFYALSQGGKVGGKVGGLARLSEFCKDPKRSPSRNEALKQRALYGPHLAAWIACAKPMWEEGKAVSERTTLEGHQEVTLELHEVMLQAGARCDLKGCVACVPCRTLKVPASLAGEEDQIGVPQGVPEHTTHLTDRMAAALAADDALEATRLLRDTMEFLLRYFAGVATILCRQMEIFPANAHRYTENYQLVDNCERLLHLCVEALKEHPDDPSAKLLVGVFYRRNEFFEFVPRSHTNILLLEDVLSTWFKTERGGTTATEPKSRADFERYFPLLRDWLGAMGPYFSHAEHYEEPPSKDGRLPLTLRLGERLLELVAPDYILRIRQCPICLPDPEWVTNPRPQAPAPAAAATPASEPAAAASTSPTVPAPVEAAPVDTRMPSVVRGEFRLVKVPNRCPRFLERVLKRLDIYMRRDEMAETWSALRDGLDYLTRYWAGVSTLAAKSLGVLKPRVAELAESSMSVEQCERVLILNLESLIPSMDDELAQEVRHVFFSRKQYSEQDQPTGSHARMIQMDADPKNKMQLLSEFCAREPEADKHKCRREVKTFLPVLRDWLSASERWFEQCEHFEEMPDETGRVEFVVQFDTTYLELVAPDYVFYVHVGSDAVPELEVPEYVEPAEVVAPVEAAPQAKPLTAEELAMQEPFLLHKVAYVGNQKNSQGAICKSGIIKIQNAGGGTLSGTAFSTHPCLEVSPRRFKDNSQLTYWLNEAEVPRDYSPVIVLRSGTDERQVTLNEMRPLGRLSTATPAQARVLMAAPAVLGVLLFACVFLVIGADIRHILSTCSIGSLGQVNPAELDLMLGKGNWIGCFFLFLPMGAPMLTYYLYRQLPPTLQDHALADLRRMIWLPMVLVTPLEVLPVFRTDITQRWEISNIYMPHLFPWFIFFNVCTMIYINLNLNQKIQEWIEEPAFQKLVPVVLFGLYIMCATLALM